MCQASILLPQEAQVNIEQLLAQGDHDSGASSNACKNEYAPSPVPVPDNSLWVQILQTMGPTADTSTGTSAPSTGAFSAGGLSCVLGQAVAIPDDPQCTRLDIRQAHSLPDPSGTELFHPPQYRCDVCV